jgi:hypothetical protein
VKGAAFRADRCVLIGDTATDARSDTSPSMEFGYIDRPGSAFVRNKFYGNRFDNVYTEL